MCWGKEAIDTVCHWKGNKYNSVHSTDLTTVFICLEYIPQSGICTTPTVHEESSSWSHRSPEWYDILWHMHKASYTKAESKPLVWCKNIRSSYCRKWEQKSQENMQVLRDQERIHEVHDVISHDNYEHGLISIYYFRLGSVHTVKTQSLTWRVYNLAQHLVSLYSVLVFNRFSLVPTVNIRDFNSSILNAKDHRRLIL